MTFLLILWAASFAVLLLLGGLGLRATATGIATPAYHPRSLREVLVYELHHFWDLCRALFAHLRPHAERAGLVATAQISHLADKGHAYMQRKVFGKIEVEKGAAPSFYLKNIAETKAESRDEDAARTAEIGKF